MEYEKWSKEDLEYVRKERKNGKSVSDIAFDLYRSKYAVKSVIKKINLAKKLGLKAGTKAFNEKVAMGENQLRRFVYQN